LTKIDFVSKEIEKAEKMRNFKATEWTPDFSINPITDANKLPKKEKTAQDLAIGKLNLVSM
jgi:hypothetical protein